MESLTKRQKDVLLKLQEGIKDNLTTITAAQLQRHFGFKSSYAAQRHLAELKRKGYIKNNPNEPFQILKQVTQGAKNDSK